MTDLELSRKLQEIGKDSKVKQAVGLSNLKKRIETDLFISDAADNQDVLKIHEENLAFLNFCIDIYKENKLTKDNMKELNLLNRKYKRLKIFEV